MKTDAAKVSILLGIFSFIQLLGAEKAILAIIFWLVAIKSSEGRKELAIIGTILGIIYIIIVIIFLPQIMQGLGILM